MSAHSQGLIGELSQVARSSTNYLYRLLNSGRRFRIAEFQWFLIALSVRPFNVFVIYAQRLPSSMWNR
jgi:hypothetical protein